MNASDRPVEGRADTVDALFSIVTHPAFRIGFLDAQAGRPLDHEEIIKRIARETPPSALARIGWAEQEFPGLFDRTQAAERRWTAVQVAQYRYEEGRMLVTEFGLRCKAWGHPDFPPAAVMRKIRELADERSARKEAA